MAINKTLTIVGAVLGSISAAFTIATGSEVAYDYITKEAERNAAQEYIYLYERDYLFSWDEHLSNSVFESLFKDSKDQNALKTNVIKLIEDDKDRKRAIIKMLGHFSSAARCMYDDRCHEATIQGYYPHFICHLWDRVAFYVFKKLNEWDTNNNYLGRFIYHNCNSYESLKTQLHSNPIG